MSERDDLVLEHLKRFQAQMADFKESLEANTREIRAMKHHMAGLITSGTNQEAEID